MSPSSGLLRKLVPNPLYLRRERLVAPDLLMSECANILWKKVRRREMTEQEALLGARLLARSDVQLEETRPLLEPATRLAISLDHPAYDCIYLALAERLDCSFVTADSSLVRKLRTARSPLAVRQLGHQR